MKGSKLLQVVSIILTVIASIGTLISLLALVGGGALLGTSTAIDGIDGALVGGIVLIASIILLIVCVFELIMGILGIKNCKNPAKAQTCFVLGIIVLVLQCISLVTSLTSGSFSITSLFGFILPALYTYGAYQLKQNNITE